MIAVILAAGTSSRLRPITDHLPKCLLPVHGVSLLERTLRSLPPERIRKAVIVVGYQAPAIRRFLADMPAFLPVTLVANHQYAETNNNASLWRAAAESAGQEILLMDSDILFHPSLIARLLDDPHANALLLRDKGTVGEEEIKVIRGSDGRVLRIGKELSAEEAAGESLGIEKFSTVAATHLFRILSNRHSIDEFYEMAFQELVDDGVRLYAVSSGDIPCMEIDTPEDLERAQAMAREIDG
jgi:choline kinase